MPQAIISMGGIIMNHATRPSGGKTPNEQVGLVEALHDHLKGKLGAAAVTLGGALQGQAGYGGVCADGKGAFLKAALLYLSTEQVRKFSLFDESKCFRGRNASEAGPLRHEQPKPPSSPKQVYRYLIV